MHPALVAGFFIRPLNGRVIYFYSNLLPMSFSSLPIVDDNSKASEESVLAVRGFFTRTNGFICREEFPDYGTDFGVELIKDSNQASGKKFPIQIKSSGKIHIISREGQEYLSKSFSTSRLYYLCQQSPAYGLIIFYDESAKACFYDFAEDVFSRLILERDNDEWKKQDSVQIHVPKTNLLTADAIRTIHEKLLSRFHAHDMLINQHGDEYDIPSFELPGKNKKASDIMDMPAAEILRKYGLMFINSSDVLLLYRILGQVPLYETLASKELIFIASIVYGEMGKCLEAELYLTKAWQIFDKYQDYEKETLIFTRIKVDFLLGKRNDAEFMQDLEGMTAITKSTFNAIQLKINLIYYTILQRIQEGKLDDVLERKLIELFMQIEVADLDAEKKMFLDVFHASNLHMFVSSLMLKWVGNLHIREALKIHVPQGERISMHVKSNKLIQMAVARVVGARSFALKEKNNLLQAHAEFALARFFLTREFDFFLLRFKEEKPDKEKHFMQNLLFALHSYKLFQDLALYRDARLAIMCAYDLCRLARLYHKLDISAQGISEAKMEEYLRASEAEMGIKTPYVSVVDKPFEMYLREQNEYIANEPFAGKTDGEIVNSAQIILDAYGIPPERLVNIVNEMKIYRYFSDFGDNENYVVLCDLTHYSSKATTFAAPVSFIIKNKKTGIESLPFFDIEKAALDFGALKK